jgi:hypothetical protein
MSFEALKDITDRGEVILVRNCFIEASDGEISPLTLTFTRPVPHDDRYWGSLRMSCKHFDKVERFSGEDEVEVLCRLLWIGRIALELREADGYSIWHQVKGDLHYFDFWSGSEFQQEFCLPSAYTAAKEAAFYKANAGKTLMPAHRIGIEPDRPAITIYTVNKDGTDRLGCVIGAEEMKGHTWESLEQLVGKRILWDSREGIELMIALQPDRRAAD